MTDNDGISLASTDNSEAETESFSPELKTNSLELDGDQSRDLRVRLELLKRRYEDELTSFSEYKIEHVLKNSGAKEYLERVREKERANNDIIASLREELELKRKEVDLWRSKCQVAEQQCSTYWRNWKDAQVRKDQLEAERATMEEERQLGMSKSMNFSCASSLVDQSVPPPPPINVPTVEEIMKLTNTSSLHLHQNASSTSQLLPNMSGYSNNNQSMGSNMSGHLYSSSSSLLHGLHHHSDSPSAALPPPIVDFSGANLRSQFHHQATGARSNSSTNGSGSNAGGNGFSKNGTTGVGGRYGKVFNSRSGGLA